MIHENAGQAVAHRAVDQHRGHRAVHAARQPADDPLVRAHQVADAGHFALDEVPGSPIGNAAADLEEKVVEDLTATRRVRHFGVELHAEEWLPGMLHRRDRGIVAPGGHLVAWRRHVHVIAVAHPDRRLLAGPEPAEEPATLHGHVRPAVLPAARAGHVSAREMGEKLHAVAEAEHRGAEAEQLGIGGGDALAVDRVGPAGEDDPFGVPLADPLHRARRRMDLAVDMGLAHPARDELGVLRAEIDDEDAVVMGCAQGDTFSV